MTKARVYQLAKELNTNSKRLIEKLSEIDIMVKNHMSLLEEEQINALYAYIGVRDEQERKEEQEKKPQIVAPTTEKKIKTGPRIIRKTQINYDEQEEIAKKNASAKVKGKRVKVTDETTGLMPGLLRGNQTNKKKENTIKEDISKDATKENIQSKKQDEKQNEKTVSKDSQTKKKSEELFLKPEKVVKDVSSKESKNENRKKEVGEKAVKKSQSLEKEKTTEQNTTEQKFYSTARSAPKNNNKRGSAETKNKSAHSYGNFKSNNTKDNVASSTKNDFRANRNEQRGSNTNNNQTGRTFNKDNNRQADKNTSQNRPYQGSNRGNTNKNTKQDKGTGVDKLIKAASLKDELTPAATKPESKRDYIGKMAAKEVQKDPKKDVKKDYSKPNMQKPEKKINKNILKGEKKGVSEVLSDDYVLKEFYNDQGRRRKINKKNKAKEPPPPPIPVVTVVKISGDVTVKQLAEALKKTSTEVIKKLMLLGVMATVNQEVDIDTAMLVGDEFGIKVEKEVLVSEEDILFDEDEGPDENAIKRPPVVVVMGHVDHGKTSLLDVLRKSNVTDKEQGGITQHIGAYRVKCKDRSVTFLDTPGHEAFTSMRARGAKVTDIAILVVAADDGVMPQTVEAINHAKAANVEIIVAINKVDKPGANPERVKQELTEHGLVVEEWGGDIISVPVSAKEETNIEQLLEMVLLSSDMLELKANPDRQAKGTVIEAKLDKDRGPVATVLVQRGTLKQGDSVVSGTSVGRVRAMINDKGENIKDAGPSTPVEILGISDVLESGEVFYSIKDEKVAKQLAEKRKFKIREQTIKSTTRVTLDDLYSQIKEGKVKDLNIIVKADVHGSVEAVRQSLLKLTNDEVRVNVIHGGVGTITESDVTFADVSNAIIIGFNVRPTANVSELAKASGVDLRLYTIIYKAIEDIESAMKGLLDPTYKEVVLGHIQIRQIFKASGIGTIGGGYVTDGKVLRNSQIRLLRDGVVMHEGKLGSLKRFKDDAKEVKQGFECGFTVENYNDIKEDDVIECFQMEEVKR